MNDLERTLWGVEHLGWRIVLLAGHTKRPAGDSWQITRDLDVIYEHCWRGDGQNIGLVCGPESNVAVLDFDETGVIAEMCTELGPLLPWVQTGSGKYHVYVAWEEGLPAKFMWRGERVGEIQRGPALQHVVMPPSIHPDTGKPYIWLQRFEEDPRIIASSKLPDLWRKHLLEDVIPSFIPVGNREGQPADEVWGGPPPEEILRRAMEQPGAKRRRNGVKFQCPGCRKEGHDKSRDNAIVYEDGRWGCALSSNHSRDIGEVLGVVSVKQEVLGDSADDLRDVSLDDLD